jgi:hypothetical protein
MKKVRVVMVVAIATITTGCSGVMANRWFEDDQGRILISADERGMRAFGDSVNGLMTTAKTEGGNDNAHFDLRRRQNETRQIKLKLMNINQGRAEK